MDAHSSTPVRMPIDLSLAPDCRMGDAAIHPSRLGVAGPLGEVTIEPRVMQVLVVLCEAGGATVSRETLLDRCWPGVTVGDDAVNRAIAEARRALRDSGAGAAIETVPRIGYRIEGVGNDAVPAPNARTEASAPSVSRRAVLAGGGLRGGGH